MVDTRVFARLAQRHGPRIVEQAIDHLMEPGTAVKRSVKPSLGRRLATSALLRVATKSVPGAVLVGGGLLARAVFEQRRAKRALRKSDS